jgi:hypothetical protein
LAAWPTPHDANIYCNVHVHVHVEGCFSGLFRPLAYSFHLTVLWHADPPLEIFHTRSAPTPTEGPGRGLQVRLM